MQTKNAPAGFEWKQVEARENAPVYPHRWAEVRYMGTRGAGVVILMALVPIGQPAVKRVDLESLLR